MIDDGILSKLMCRTKKDYLALIKGRKVIAKFLPENRGRGWPGHWEQTRDAPQGSRPTVSLLEMLLYVLDHRTANEAASAFVLTAILLRHCRFCLDPFIIHSALRPSIVAFLGNFHIRQATKSRDMAPVERKAKRGRVSMETRNR